MNKIDREELFFKSAFLRHQIYVLKELGINKPWTRNFVFRNYYFCNVFRYLDKTSKWIITNAIEPNENNEELWKTIIMCRYISRIDTLQILKEHDCLIDNQQKAYDVLRGMQTCEEKIFTSAFIVNSKVPGGWSDKVTYLFTLLAEVKKRFNSPNYFFTECSRMEVMYDCFFELPGIANFMAYQYTVDFTYSKRYLYKATDKSSWVSLGLGAIRGMNRLLSGEVSKDKIPNSKELAIELLEKWKVYVRKHLRELIKETQKIVDKRWLHELESIPNVSPLFVPFNNLDLRDVQHWLCEYDKYCRGGSKKRRYPGI